MIPQTLSAHFPDPLDAQTVLDAAERARKTPSAFIRDAALAEAAKVQNKCPSCGRPRKQKRAA